MGERSVLQRGILELWRAGCSMEETWVNGADGFLVRGYIIRMLCSLCLASEGQDERYAYECGHCD